MARQYTHPNAGAPLHRPDPPPAPDPHHHQKQSESRAAPFHHLADSSLQLDARVSHSRSLPRLGLLPALPAHRVYRKPGPVVAASWTVSGATSVRSSITSPQEYRRRYADDEWQCAAEGVRAVRGKAVYIRPERLPGKDGEQAVAHPTCSQDGYGRDKPLHHFPHGRPEPLVCAGCGRHVAIVKPISFTVSPSHPLFSRQPNTLPPCELSKNPSPAGATLPFNPASWRAPKSAANSPNF